jgi:hypothetical protein
MTKQQRIEHLENRIRGLENTITQQQGTIIAQANELDVLRDLPATVQAIRDGWIDGRHYEDVSDKDRLHWIYKELETLTGELERAA